MANLLTRKVMDNMSRQYRNENGINSSTTSQNANTGNINFNEESLLIGLIKNNSSNKVKPSCVITLEDLAKKHGK